ncbi:M28 family peptidase [Saccharopolyspora cebuensis]|uniref:M28 family peptidase n=1 Tax=Saccharopolyspora cebuensis TaxID=418759 RepID=A0ABV4CD58_9PSEU
MSASTDAPAPSRRWPALLGLAALVLLAVLTVLAGRPAAPVAADAPASVFSSGRAMGHIERIAAAPRTPGSAHHAATREHLVDLLTSWGWRTEVRREVGAAAGDGGTQRLAAVSNIVATLPGTDPTGTVLLAAHYDSVPNSPGAADDGIGVGTLLETARAIGAGGAAPRNDLTLLITDAEEVGLLGAEAFVRHHADELGTAVLLNHEARGNAGTPTTFRTTSPNGALLEVLSHAPGTVANSAFEAAFEALPNDTDVTRFTEGGLHSYDTAITGGGAYYHTPLDTPERLSESSVQHMGRASLAMTRELAAADLAAVPAADEDLVITLPWGPVPYPQAAEGPLAWAMLGLAAVAVGLARRRELTLPRTALATAGTAVALVAAGAAAVAVWQVAVALDPGQASAFVGVPYRPEPYSAAMLLAALGAVLAVPALLRRPLGTAALAAGGWIVFAVLGVVAATTMPGTSALLVPPVLPVVAGAVLLGLLPRGWEPARVVVLVLSLVPAVLLLAPNVINSFRVDLEFGGVLGALLLAVLVWSALPLLGRLRSGRARSPLRAAGAPVLGIALVAAVTAAGLVANRPEFTPPRQERVFYSVDADTGTARWASPITPRTDWGRSLLPEPPAVLAEGFPWLDDEPLAHGPAPAADLPAPELHVVADRPLPDGTRELALRLSSPRGATALGLWIDGDQAAVRAATVAGRDLDLGAGEDFGFLFAGAPRRGLDVRLVVDPHHEGLTVRVADRGHDTGAVPGFRAPDDVALVTPAVAVTRTRTL